MAVLINAPSSSLFATHLPQLPKDNQDFDSSIPISELVDPELSRPAIKRSNTTQEHSHSLKVPDIPSSRTRSNSCPSNDTRIASSDLHEVNVEPSSSYCGSTVEMSGYYYVPDDHDEDDDDLQQQQQQQHRHRQQQAQFPRYALPYQQSPAPYTTTLNPAFSTYAVNPASVAYSSPPQRYAVNPQNLMAAQQYSHQPPLMSPPLQQQNWAVSSPPQQTYNFPSYQPSLNYSQAFSMMGQPALTSMSDFLTPPPAISGPSRPRPTRTISNASRASSVSYNTDNSRGESPSAAEMARWGTRNQDGSWSCSHTGCTSRSTFTRGCDLRKHYKRHTKTLFCRHPGCPQGSRNGFSSNKDRTRHEQSHDPNILCEWGCGRKFSRVDNMKDHVRRVHQKWTAGDRADR